MGCTTLLFKLLNPIMKAILRSPLHSMVSGRIMIIRFTGRKSSKTYSTPVSYYREDGLVVCFTHGKWWRNIGDGAVVNVRIRGVDYEGHAVAVTDDVAEKTAYLIKYLKAVPSDAGFYAVKFDDRGEPIRTDIDRAVSEAVMIRITINE